MKPSELAAQVSKDQPKIMRALSLGYVRTHSSVNGVGSAPSVSAPNRAALRRAKFKHSENSAFGHIYADSVDPAEVARRRKANKVARAQRKLNRGK